MSAARQSLEAALLEEFSKLSGHEINAVSYVPDSEKISIPKETMVENLAVRHIPIAKGNPFSCLKAAVSFAKYLITEIPSGSQVLMYAVNPVFMLPLVVLKSIKKLRLTTICSEVPAFRRHNNSFVMKIKKAVQTFLNNRFDRYILLAEPMKEVVAVGNKPYLVMEGVASGLLQAPSTGKRRNIVMYAGGLHPDNNIMTLIEACEKSDEVKECWICGSGPHEEELKKRIGDNRKFKMLGRLAHDDVLALEKQVKILVNLRDPRNELTRYSFPSKIIEYLASGAQVISTKLEGIPSEYFDYVHPLTECNSDELVRIIDSVMTMSDKEIEEKAESALEFLKNNKSARVQSRRIIDFICQTD